MFADHNPAILDILTRIPSITAEQLEDLLREQKESGKTLAQAAIDLGLIKCDSLFARIADNLGLTFVNNVVPAPAPLIAKVSKELAYMYRIYPYAEEGYQLQLLVEDPFNFSVLENLSFALKQDVAFVVADPHEVKRLIDESYGTEDLGVSEAANVLAGLGKVAANLSEHELKAASAEAPVVRFVNLVLDKAIREKASDIHFEPFEDVFNIRYRVDGTLFEMAPVPVNLSLPVISRIKVLANLNIAEKRVPQDGRIQRKLDARSVDIRVSTLPTQHGESVVLRILDKTIVNLDLNHLGMNSALEKKVEALIRQPNGVFVVTGPTGSGKNTTLYSCLKMLNTEEVKILTAEDPVEYEMDGIMQVAVKSQIGLSFAHALRSFLRQDPDILMVGEIRDLETAQISFQAAQTGHLVFTTLHTNDSAGTVTRLVDMGMEPYMIASSLVAILAQRLVRTLCKSCRENYRPDDFLLQQLHGNITPGNYFAWKPVGCASCRHSGYKGRKGIFELMPVSDSLKDMIIDGSSTQSIKATAIEQGMIPLRESGIEAVKSGLTSIEEILGAC